MSATLGLMVLQKQISGDRIEFKKSSKICRPRCVRLYVCPAVPSLATHVWPHGSRIPAAPPPLYPPPSTPLQPWQEKGEKDLPLPRLFVFSVWKKKFFPAVTFPGVGQTAFTWLPLAAWENWGPPAFVVEHGQAERTWKRALSEPSFENLPQFDTPDSSFSRISIFFMLPFSFLPLFQLLIYLGNVLLSLSCVFQKRKPNSSCKG